MPAPETCIALPTRLTRRAGTQAGLRIFFDGIAQTIESFDGRAFAPVVEPTLCASAANSPASLAGIIFRHCRRRRTSASVANLSSTGRNSAPASTWNTIAFWSAMAGRCKMYYAGRATATSKIWGVENTIPGQHQENVSWDYWAFMRTGSSVPSRRKIILRPAHSMRLPRKAPIQTAV